MLFRSHNNLGYILTREGDYKNAEAEFRTALSYTPDFESAQLNLKNVLQLETLQSYNEHGVELMQQGKYKDAEAVFRQVLQYQPDNPVAQNNLAFLMLQSGQDVDMALSLAESARRSMPHSTNTADTLAWAYYHKGIYGSARALLEDAAKTNPNDASIQYHLGMVYSKMGNKADAVDHLKKAVSLAPGTQTGNDANKALSSLGT